MVFKDKIIVKLVRSPKLILEQQNKFKIDTCYYLYYIKRKEIKSYVTKAIGECVLSHV